MKEQGNNILNIKDFSKVTDKKRGKEPGAIFEYNNQRYMLKHMDISSTISELVGSRVAKLLAGDSVPTVMLVKGTKGGVYSASKYIENFISLSDHGMVGSPNSEEVDLAIEFVNHGDIHDQNKGIIKAIDGHNILAAIVDFSSSLGTGRLSLGKQYNPSRMFEALEKLNSITPEAIDIILNDSFVELKQYYPNDQHSYLDKKQAEIKENLLDRRQHLIMMKDQVAIERDILEFFIACKKNDRASYNQLLSKRIIDQDPLGEDLREAIVNNLDEEFPTARALLGKIFNDAVRYNSQAIFDKLLIKIKDQDIFEEAFMNAVRNNRLEMFERLLLKVADQEALESAFTNAVQGNRQEIFDQLLSKISDQKQLGEALGLAVQNNRAEIFDQLLSKISDQKQLGEALGLAVQNNRAEMFDQLLSKISDQKQLGEALGLAVQSNRSEMFEQLLPKVTNQSDLEEAFNHVQSGNKHEIFNQLLPKISSKLLLERAFNYAIEHNLQDAFNQLLPKISSKLLLEERAFNYAIRHNLQEAFNQLLPKVTQYRLGEGLGSAVINNKYEIFDQLLPKITDQDQLGQALYYAVATNNKEMFDKLLPNINHKLALNKALNTAKDKAYEAIIASIEKRIFAIDHPIIEAPTATLESMNWAKESDSIKLARRAEAAKITTRDSSQIMAASNINANSIVAESTTKALPDGDIHSGNNQPVQASSGMFAQQINQHLFIGITAFAFAMKALGLGTDWLRPALGGRTDEVKMDFDPKDLPLHTNPEYDYSLMIEEMAKKAPPFQKAAFHEITKKAKTGEAKDWSEEDWQNFMKDSNQFNAFIDALELEAKRMAAKSCPLTEKDIEVTKVKVQQTPYRKKILKSVRSGK